ncbi:hypothetical protein [Fuerstiella marisgermanici]|uniref:Secreted protein n=1 Tax=Fuerstiella marisgermanici TaxID=1891926 RepID=A0A1P8WFB3_9PLAN|nr:hypothetical protein [Fuerstiella marisgermanici]APZ92768.1 hypothetical protein Fuma_02380 [Fuerstiella marisgermanici]
MSVRLPKLVSLLLLPMALCIAGCADTADDNSAPVTDLPPATVDDHDGHDHGTHDHPSEGPHHGELVELGDDQYHGEVVHNEETGGVTVYILDGSATKQVAIDAADVRINVKHGDKPEQFKLAAKPDDGDEDGKSSRFASANKELGTLLDADGAAPQLVVKIDGKSYRGSISHSHDHEGHDHAH